MATIVIKPGLGIDSTKGPGPELPEFTQPKKLIFFEILIFYMKKLRNNPYRYMLYIL